MTSHPVRLELPLAHGVLRRRYKRFLADVVTDDGRAQTVHCPNSGSMRGMDAPGLPVVFSDSGNPARKLRHTLELVQVDDGAGRAWVGVHTGRPNDMVRRAVRMGRVPGVPPDAPLRIEVPYGTNSRVDILVEPDDGPPVYIEVKNTTLAGRAPDGALEARFPDAVTARGQKHLRELVRCVERGERAVLVFLVNRHDCVRFAPAADIDPDYAALLAEAREAGVETLPLQVRHHVRRRGAEASASWRFVGALPVGA